jgi:hypothetical protein
MGVLEREGSTRKAAKSLGVHNSCVDSAVKSIKKKMALQGVAPEFGMTQEVPSPLVLRGTSDFYKVDADGNKILKHQWVKTKLDDQLRALMIQEAIEEACNAIPRIAPVKAPKTGAKNLANVLTATDCHIGMKAWGEETGSDWDLKIAEKTLTSCFKHLLDNAPPARTCVVAQLGDFLHYDGLMAVTPTSGHNLDADSRFSKMVRVAIRILRRIVAMALEKHDKVILVIAEGNHDIASSVWLRHLFCALYENEPRVEIINTELPYYAWQFGKTMLGWHHSHLSRMENLPGVFAARYSKMWGETEHRFIHTGDKHHAKELDKDGVTVIQHATLASADAYAARYGYSATRKASLITYNDTNGEVARITVHPDMVAPK